MATQSTPSLADELAPGLLERFERYVRVDTQAARGPRAQSPSTPGQLDLARLLRDELAELGLEDVVLDEHGYVYATLPATVEGTETIGLVAHMDVSPDAPGAGVEPIVHRDYDGSRIELPRGGTVLDPATMPALRDALGHDVVTSSGDTLLGADDKAGVAEIMTAVAHLAAHPELPRPRIRVGFTPDEEIGEGATLFDIEGFGARCAYTLDGSSRGELQDETFTAAALTLTVTGVDIHPGSAKGVMVNALRILARTFARLPEDGLSPETTAGREGFVHLHTITGDAARATAELIVRDFDDELLAQHADLVEGLVREEVERSPGARLEVERVAQYPNMRTYLEPHPEVVQAALQALEAEGIEPVRSPVRGGTDGSVLSARGLPTPNLFTGGHEYHSVREWASLQDMAAAASVVVRLAEIWTGPTYISR